MNRFFHISEWAFVRSQGDWDSIVLEKRDGPNGWGRRNGGINCDSAFVLTPEYDWDKHRARSQKHSHATEECH